MKILIKLAETIGDAAEHVTDLRAKQSQDSDNDDSYQDENQCVLYQTLTIFTM